MFIKFFVCNVDLVLVQTESMKRQFIRKFPRIPIVIRPFSAASLDKVTQHSNEYIYPARGDESKNHRALVKAWIYLSELGIFPDLILTVDENIYPDLTSWIVNMKKHSLKITNIGYVEDSVVSSYYIGGINLIFPSFLSLLEFHWLRQMHWT